MSSTVDSNVLQRRVAELVSCREEEFQAGHRTSRSCEPQGDSSPALPWSRPREEPRGPISASIVPPKEGGEPTVLDESLWASGTSLRRGCDEEDHGVRGRARTGAEARAGECFPVDGLLGRRHGTARRLAGRLDAFEQPH